MSRRLQPAIEAAFALRAELVGDTRLDACRLFHGNADGVPGLVIERLGPVLVVQIHQGHFEGDLGELRDAVAALADRLGVRAVYRKVFVPDRSRASENVARLHTDPVPWIGERVAGDSRDAPGISRRRTHRKAER